MEIQGLEGKKICVGLSGGVDSSVAALLLKRQGYDVFALFMQNWNDASTTLHGDCEWEEDRFVAEMVARKIGIPFYFVDLSKEYRARVTDYMFDEYSRGRTPNPDVLCNSEIKFDAFLRCARGLGADYVATGHYCRKEVLDGVYRLLAGSDFNKDQSYFLCGLSQEQLSVALFPIGDITKPEVRRLAKEADLPSADKKDSQGLCFVGKVNLPTFLKQALAPAEGDVVEVFDAYYGDNEEYRWQSALLQSLRGGSNSDAVNGNLEKGNDATYANEGFAPEKLNALTDEELERLASPITYDIKFETETYRSGRHHTKKTRYKDNPHGRLAGKHEGAFYYTIGQRKGLAIGGHKSPIFVIGNDIARNIIYVGEGENHKGLYRSCLKVNADEIHWMRPALEMGVGKTLRCLVRIRYRQPLQSATLLMRESGLYILFDEPQRGITPGQFAVWYAPDSELLGSGPISK